MTADALVGVLSESAINGRSFATRASDLAQPERASYLRILQHFIEGAPSPLRAPCASAVAALIQADLVRVDGGGRVAVAYPFSAQPTRHRVTLRDGRSYHAMCAIDALGIPYMLDHRGEVQAHEPDAHLIVHVTIDPDGQPTWTPAQAVALAAFSEGCCLAESACPHINLFTSTDAATRYRDTHELQGSVLSITDAAKAGRWLFGDLLHSLADAEVR
jgi:Alkylmercury lyase